MYYVYIFVFIKLRTAYLHNWHGSVSSSICVQKNENRIENPIGSIFRRK